MPSTIPISTTSGYEKDGYKKLQSHDDRSQLGKDQFLRILIAQLQHQDPTQPLQDKEFIAQMATFSSVESLANMSKEFSSFRNSIGQASLLIDKEVAWSEYSESEGKWNVNKGVVSSIIMKDHIPYAVVGEKHIPVDDISSVTTA